MADLSTRIGRLRLKNPVIAAAGEHLMDAAGIRSAILAGAGAVVGKSTNESDAAKDQLTRAEYELLRTFVLNPGGELAVQMPQFDPCVTHVDFVRGSDGWQAEKGQIAPIPPVAEADYPASARLGARWLDVVTTSGLATGQAPDLAKIATFRAAMGDRPLAVTDIITSGWYDYHAKYSVGGSRHEIPANIPAEIEAACRDYALRAHQAAVFPCRFEKLRLLDHRR